MQPSLSNYGQDVISDLYQHHARTIFKYALACTRSYEDAEDIVVDVFMAALGFAHLDSLSETQQLAWLLRVAHNKVIDLRRKVTRQTFIPLEAIQEQIFDENNEHLPENQALHQEQLRILRQQIDQLPPQQRELVTLRFISNLRCTEIAQIVGKTENSVRVALSRALNTLRIQYKTDLEERPL